MVNVIVSGTFDLFHKGHEMLLRYAAQIPAERRVVLVNGDKKLRNEKKTMQNQDKRREVVRQRASALGVFDVNIGETREECLGWFKALAPCILFHGNDHNVETLSRIYGVDEDWWFKNDIFLLYKDRHKGVSSTQLREVHKYETNTQANAYECL